LQLFYLQKRDLESLYGEFEDNKSLNSIIKLEYEKWVSTDTV